MEPLKGKRVAVISREVDILSVFARELSKQRIFVQSFHPTIANWLPFMWNGFRQTTYFGYAFEHLSQLDLLWKQMSDSARRNVRRAERNGIRIIPCDSDLVAGVAEMTFVHQGRALPYSRDYLRYYYAACSARSAGQCFAAVDEKGQVHAAGFLVWDRKRAYYVAGGTDPVLRASGADSLLTWRMLQFAQERTKSFDFCGSVVKSIATFLRHFGAQLVPYYRISKLPRILRLLYP
jgi:lipid II:glycine glycyltransferase (peptidoglycan interpeptide bridge formation enzyme)